MKLEMKGVIQLPMLSGQTAVITGGAQGLGYAIAERFIAEGARVVLGDVNLEATEVAAKQLGGDDVALAVRCNVAKADEVDTLLKTAVDHFGDLDIMVNNAGITRDATMRKMTEEQFDEVISVHLKGTWNGTRLAAAIMRENKRGAIINMSSVSGKVGMVGQTNYSFPQCRHCGNDQGRRQRARLPGYPGQRDRPRPDSFGDDRGYAATDLGFQGGRGADGSGR